MQFMILLHDVGEKHVMHICIGVSISPERCQQDLRHLGN
jgi:hypothetical protein